MIYIYRLNLNPELFWLWEDNKGVWETYPYEMLTSYDIGQLLGGN